MPVNNTERLTTQTALEKLEELYPEKYLSVSLEITSHGLHKEDGLEIERKLSQECNVYLEGYGHFFASSWESAISDLQNAVKGNGKVSF